jgi:hypothetical protein
VEVEVKHVGVRTRKDAVLKLTIWTTISVLGINF